MPTLENHSCKELEGEEEMSIWDGDGSTYNHHIQISWKESMKGYFITNIVFFFAGEATVNMPYLMTQLSWVVLAPCAHSLGEEPLISTSMENKTSFMDATLSRKLLGYIDGSIIAIVTQLFCCEGHLMFRIWRDYLGIMDAMWSIILRQYQSTML